MAKSALCGWLEPGNSDKPFVGSMAIKFVCQDGKKWEPQRISVGSFAGLTAGKSGDLI